MSLFPLRLYLRNHSSIYRWEQIPGPIRALFDGTDIGIRNAEFFIADAARQKNRFSVTHAIGAELRTALADIIAIQNTDLVVLVQHPAKTRKTPAVTAFTADTVLCVGFGSSVSLNDYE